MYISVKYNKLWIDGLTGRNIHRPEQIGSLKRNIISCAKGDIAHVHEIYPPTYSFPTMQFVTCCVDTHTDQTNTCPSCDDLVFFHRSSLFISFNLVSQDRKSRQ